jgi:pimeloyl-ACP methyl ester carboxylesterase
MIDGWRAQMLARSMNPFACWPQATTTTLEAPGTLMALSVDCAMMWWPKLRAHGVAEAILSVIAVNPRSRSLAVPYKKGRVMLEVIDKGACSESHPAPLLFVHGSWHAAWCWDENFLGFFADKGYRAVALSLRNHGNSHQKNPRTCSVADWVSDVASVANSLPAEPVVIGHSMGGLVVQKYLEKRSAPAGVLLASIPVSGARRGLFA